MGLKETAKWTFLHATTPGLLYITAKNMYNLAEKTSEALDEDPSIKGFLKGYWNGYKYNVVTEFQGALEFSPLTAPIYNMAKKEGIYEGKKEGYKEASNQYEEKYNDLERKSEKQKEEWEKERDGYESLLDGYEEELSKYNKNMSI